VIGRCYDEREDRCYDTVLFFDHDIEQAKKLKLLLGTFEQLSSLKINFHKSELFCFGQAKESEEQYSYLFGCKMGSYPFPYLGLTMHYRKLNNTDYKLIEERIQKKLSGGKENIYHMGVD